MKRLGCSMNELTADAANALFDTLHSNPGNKTIYGITRARMIAMRVLQRIRDGWLSIVGGNFAFVNVPL